MKVKNIIDKKGSTVYTSTASFAVRDALNRMLENKVGALVVVDDNDNPRGIITERDVLNLIIKNENWQNATVGENMTENLLIGLPDDDIEYIMSLMTINRIRHVPIMHGGKLAGIISIGDIVKAQLKNIKAENRYLTDYITNKYPA